MMETTEFCYSKSKLNKKPHISYELNFCLRKRLVNHLVLAGLLALFDSRLRLLAVAFSLSVATVLGAFFGGLLKTSSLPLPALEEAVSSAKMVLICGGINLFLEGEPGGSASALVKSNRVLQVSLKRALFLAANLVTLPTPVAGAAMVALAAAALQVGSLYNTSFCFYWGKHYKDKPITPQWKDSSCHAL